MALTFETKDVPLLPQQQQAPESSAPVGRLRRLVNGVAKKFQRREDVGQTIKVEKRDGMGLLTSSVVFAGQSATALSSPTLLSKLGDQLVLVDAENPCVLAEHAPAWVRQPYTLPTYALSQKVVHAPNDQITIPDGAAAGGVHMYTWTTADGTPQFEMLDADGTAIRGVTSTIGSRQKVVSDGTRFWNFLQTGATVSVSVLSNTGAVISGGSTVLTAETGSPWDVTYDSVRGVVAAIRSGGLTHVVFLSLSGSTVVINDTHDSSLTSGHVYAGLDGLAFLTNDRADGFVYIASLDLNNQILVWQVNGSGVATHTYTVDSLVTDIVNVCGAVSATGAADITLLVGTLTTTDTLTERTRFYAVPFSGSASLTETMLTVAPASRAFRLGGRYYAVLYYGSRRSVSSNINSNRLLGQPTFFLVDVATRQITGRWDRGLAAMSWATNLEFRTDPSGTALTFDARWHLSSVFSSTADNKLHVPLGVNLQSMSILQDNISPAADITFQGWTVGLKDLAIDAPGRTVEYSGELFLPGPQPTSFGGRAFTEQSVAIAPETPVLTTADFTATPPDANPGLTRNVTYTYIVVFEWTEPNGDRGRSTPSIPVSKPMGAHNAISLALQPLHVTNRTDLIISVYRNRIEGGIPTTEFSKVTNDLHPVLNDKTATTITFVDSMSDAAASLGEKLYTTPGAAQQALSRDPCPAFHVGCVFANRVFVAAYDGSIWYSAEKTPGDALWFNTDVQRVFMPTSSPIRFLAPLDDRILIGCENSIWQLTADAFPDATGLGGRVNMPKELPFSNGAAAPGAAGPFEVVQAGIVYASSAGGVWTITRGMDNAQLGAPAVDDLASRTIRDIVTDVNQRLIIAHDQGEEVWDTVSVVWSAWTHTTAPQYAVVWLGQYVFVDSTGVVRRQVAGQVFDDTNTAIITTTDILPAQLGGIRNYKRVSEAQMQGTRVGDHDMTVTVTYVDDEDTTATSVHAFTPNSTAPYVYQIPLSRELVRALGFVFVDSFPHGATGGYALELLAFTVGLEKSLTRVPVAKRIAPTG
jgi:hypothetical protein